MFCGARPRLNLCIHTLIGNNVSSLNDLWSPSGIETKKYTTVALRGRQVEASASGKPKKTTVTVDELVTRQPHAPTRRWSARGWEPDAGCSCGCGSGDGHARRLEGPATHDEPRRSPACRQSETRTALPPRQTMRQCRAPA